MTTICTDGKTIAADGRITQGGVILQDDRKKVFKPETNLELDGEKILYVAFAGAVHDVDYVLGHLLEGSHHKIEKLNSDVMMVTRNKIFLIDTETSDYIYEWTGSYCCIGSGSYFALSAMNLGLNPTQAVRHASKFDTCTGPKVKTYKIKD